MASLEELTAKIAGVLGPDSGLGKSFKIDLKGEGFIHISETDVINDDLPADLTVKVSRRDLEALGKGQLNPMTAVITGRLQVSDMSLAMSLQPQMQALFAKLA
jgi:putative sterol carrier protein